MRRLTRPTSSTLIILPIIISVILVSRFSIAQGSGDLEGFEDEIDSPQINHISSPGQASHLESDVKASASTASGLQDTPDQDSQREAGTYIPKTAKYILEIGSAVVLVIYLAVAWFGMVANKSIAEAWAKEFTFRGGVFDRNFTSLGPESKAVIMKESGSVFK